jgi:mRNA-degrading endonuclease RelE of RelBE toxin-antitoxin system
MPSSKLTIKLSKHSYRTLTKLQHTNLQTAKLIVKKIDQLAADPKSLPAKRLTRHSAFNRIRVSDHRIIFKTQDNNLLIFIIDHRSKVYRQLEKQLRQTIFDD